MGYMLDGAQYRRKDRLYRLIGRKSKTFWVEDEATGDKFEAPNSMMDEFVATGVHDHVNYCCSEHNLHVSPHTGCLFR